ncbi:MAG: hypothetical protein WC966_06545 [Bradymonadales bacterium]
MKKIVRRNLYLLLGQCVFCLSLCMAPSFGNATLVESLSLEELSVAADMIAIGRVVDMRAEWSEEYLRIETLCVLELEQCIKGDCKEKIEFKKRGGSVGSLHQVVIGEPQFDLGDELVVFLEKLERGYFFLGLTQGKYRIEWQNAKRMAVGDAGDLQLYDRRTKRSFEHEASVLPLEDFVDLIQAYIQR